MRGEYVKLTRTFWEKARKDGNSKKMCRVKNEKYVEKKLLKEEENQNKKKIKKREKSREEKLVSEKRVEE